MIKTQSSFAAPRIDLGGKWQFCQQGSDKWLAATVPGCNFTDLLASGEIDDPFYRDNESSLQWIENHDWHYRKRFTLTAEQLSHGQWQLVAEGLDTFCDLSLNGHLLAQGQNMFVGQRIDCAEHLQVGENILEVYFHSPIKRVEPLHLQAGFTYPAENDKSTNKLSVYCRKAPCHFGWDWGPRFVTSGIWRPIYLELLETARIDDVHYELQQLDAQQAQFSFAVSLSGAKHIAAELVVECAQAPELNHSLPLSELNTRLKLSLAKPKLWWPNGLGEAFLYDFSFTLKIAGKAVSNKQLAIGLRTLEVVNQADEMGESFLFKVNGQPVFMKGANYIPADSFVHRVTAQKHQEFFAASRDANMNMLRVWGGGIYQDDEFYRLADENGILIWQDFMFACTLYPAHQAFLDNVAAEAKYNIRRLRNHACIAMWCGNNEVDMAINKWEWPQKFGYNDELYTQLKQDYITLFDKLLPDMVSQYDASRFYLRSSPIGFWENDEDNKGNHHYWGVWHGEEPFSEYQRRIPRFMSEFGFQSFPMPESMARFTEPQDQQLDSAVLQVHQKHPRGNSLIKSYMQDSFHAPKDFASLLYLSQVQQAEGLKLAFDAHRAAKPFCMGTLYWQLNDTWPAASWSGIDYYGRWKALHYQAKRSFAPQSLIVQELKEQIKVYWSNDTLAEFKGAKVVLSLLDFTGKALSQQSLNVDIAANSADLLFTAAVDELLNGQDKSQLVLLLEGYDAKGNVLCTNHHLFVPDNLLALQPVKINVAILRQQDCLELSLSADYFVRQLYLNLPDEVGNFSDNFFDLLPAQTKVVTIKLHDTSRYHEIEPLDALHLLSVYDTYAQQ